MGRARRSSEPVERPASLDRSIPFPPMEAELVRELPAGDEWQYEPKWDGFRGLLENASGELRLWSRNARPLLRYFPELAPLGDVLPPRSAIDGEIVIVRDGVLDFDAMQTRLHPAESRVRKLSAEIPARFVAFDVLIWDGVEHWQAPLAERRATLEQVGTDLTLSPLTLDLDEALSWLDSFEAIGLDGVIAKRRDKPYAAGSREAVAKVKPEKTADCVVAGLRWKADGERRIATLLLGLYDDDGELDYVGSAVVAPARHDEVAAAVHAAPEGRSRATVLRAEPLGRRRARGDRGTARARGRGALRQGAGPSLPTRDEALAGAAGQEPGAVHMAGASPAARGNRPDARPVARLTVAADLVRAHGARGRAGSLAPGARRRAAPSHTRCRSARRCRAARSPSDWFSTQSIASCSLLGPPHRRRRVETALVRAAARPCGERFTYRASCSRTSRIAERRRAATPRAARADERRGRRPTSGTPRTRPRASGSGSRPGGRTRAS